MNNIMTWQTILMNIDDSFDNKIFTSFFYDTFVNKLGRYVSDVDINEYVENYNVYIYDIINKFPSLLKELNIFIQSSSDNYRFCIISDEEVDWMAENVFIYIQSMSQENLLEDKLSDRKDQRFFRELINTIPITLKELGYGLIKKEELRFFKPQLTHQIAKALHGRYRYLMANKQMKQSTQAAYNKTYLINKDYSETDFDNLDSKIKQSNIDSAYHIVTKFLSIGYTIDKVPNGVEPDLFIMEEGDIETMAKVEHERWCWEKRLQGFIYGSIKTDNTHYCLVPYNDLPEFEKEKDRDQVRQYPIILKDLGYIVKPLNDIQQSQVSYQYRRPSHIEKSMYLLEKEIQFLSDLAQDKKDIFDSVVQLKKALYEITHVRDGIRKAEQLQHSIMTSKLSVKTVLPDSFVLFKPLDIVSGDFYFTAKIHGTIILVVADCTGHGISGAMLSMICCNLLDIAVYDNNLTDPISILKFVFNKLENLIYRQTGRTMTGDGMDIAVCSYHPDIRLLSYSGINRPLYLIQNGLLYEKKAIRCMGDKSDIINNTYYTNRILLNEGDMFYLCSDGYADQLGGKGEKSKKFGTKQFMDLLEINSLEPLSIQRERLISEHNKWKDESKENQTDDMLVIGVKV